MKAENPIEEIWRIRDHLGAEENFDVHRLFERLRREQKKYADRLVQPPSRLPPAQPADVLREESPPGSDQRPGKYGGKDTNPIEEIWRIRDQISAECGHDVHRLFERLKALETKYQDRLVSFAPGKPAAPTGKKRTTRRK
jgi:hypothetical protein